MEKCSRTQNYLLVLDIQHESLPISSNMKQQDDVQPGGSKSDGVSQKHIQKSSFSIFNADKDIEYLHVSSTVIVVKNKEPVKAEGISQGITTNNINPSPNLHSLESHLTQETVPNTSENEDPNTTSLRKMFPDLQITDENLSLNKLQQMSTTDITREIVSLNKPAILKPTARLIPQDKNWLSPLEEVDKQQETEAEKEIVQWEKESTKHKSDSESDEEIEVTIDLEEDELRKTDDSGQK